MTKRMLCRMLTVGALALALSACAAEPKPAPAASTPPLDPISFGDGAALPPETDVSWGDGFAHDDGWEEAEHLTEPGRWMYVNTDETCAAAFRGGALGDAGDMDDEQASDAVIAAELGESFGDLDGMISDGHFLRYGTEGAQVAHRQFSVTVDGSGRFMAARAFVALDYSVQVIVMCEGADVGAAAQEVLSKNMISVETEARD